jgi:hypothetical protein
MYVEAKLQWSKIITPKEKYSNFGTSYLTELNGAVYATILGKTLQMTNGNITAIIPMKLKNVVYNKGVLYANCLLTLYSNPVVVYPDGLVYSTDNGQNWTYIGTGRSFADGKLIVIDDKLFLYTKFWLAQIDLAEGAIKEIDREGINGTINTINLFRDKIYIGTDAGVYYKPYKDFYTYK